MEKKRNIVFDMGNVLIEWSPEKVLNMSTEDLVLKEEIKEFVFLSGNWLLLDEGLIDENALLHQAKSASKSENFISAIEKILGNWDQVLSPYNKVITKIQSLKRKGYRIYILSNTSSGFYKILDHQLLPLKNILDGFILSFEVKTLKPSIHIFESLLRRYDLNANECIFIDDIKENVMAAESLGFEGFVAKGENQVLAVLDGL